MNVLLGCEESGTVRDAFTALGHFAVSCDILPSRTEGKHFHGDLFEYLERTKGYWQLAIFFPPCTHLANSGAKHFAAKRADGRQQEAINFFLACANADIPRIAIENPVGIMSTAYRKPDQIIQPWQFGDEATKTTCLWLKNLPLLVPTKIVGKGDRHVTKGGNSLPVWYNLPPGPDRAKIRSKTFQGIAAAMAEQWGSI